MQVEPEKRDRFKHSVEHVKSITSTTLTEELGENESCCLSAHVCHYKDKRCLRVYFRGLKEILKLKNIGVDSSFSLIPSWTY